MAEVIGGIVQDFQRLVRQQFEMVRAEVRTDWHKTKQAMVPVVSGAALLTVGGLLFSLMFVFLLHWLTAARGSDPATLPLWSCFAIVGAIFMLIGGILVYSGVSRFKSFTPVPEQSADALKENVKWLTNNN